MKQRSGKRLSHLMRLAKQQEGGAMLWFLIAVPLLIIALAFSFETTELSHTAAWLQEALNRSAKAAAFQVTPESYSVANPVIDPIEAEYAFRALLAHNLYLDPTDLSPLASNKRVLEAPTYRLEIINGPFPLPYQNTEYGIDTTISEPTAIATIELKFNTIIAGRKITIRRFALAKVAKKE